MRSGRSIQRHMQPFAAQATAVSVTIRAIVTLPPVAAPARGHTNKTGRIDVAQPFRITAGYGADHAFLKDLQRVSCSVMSAARF